MLFDGAVAIGLHDREEPRAALTFVRPELRAYVRALRRLELELDYEHLGDGEFNSVGFTDPAGQAIALVEARTFPPAAWDPHNVLACGEFFELTLPAHRARALERASGRRWGSLASTAARRRTRGNGSSGYGVTIGLHEVHCRPGLSFRCTDLEARCEYLRAKGLAPRSRQPDRRTRAAVGDA